MKSAIRDRGFVMWATLALFTQAAALFVALNENDFYISLIIIGFVFTGLSIRGADRYYKSQKTSA